MTYKSKRKSKRNRHTGTINYYKQRILDTGKVIKLGLKSYMSVITTHIHVDTKGNKLPYTTCSMVRQPK